MTTPILIIADDLTGALDSAVPFAVRGLHVRVALGPDSIGEAVAAAPDVLAIDTRSRSLSARQAAQCVEAAWDAAKALRPRVVVKKVDSRLKGEIAAETAALLAASGRTTALACPAVPEQGREVAGGRLTGRGIDAPIVVAEQFNGACECPDAADDADLEAIAHRVLTAPDHILAVGARGLAGALANLVGGSPRGDGVPALALPLVIAIGSTDPITLAQVEQLRHDCPQVEEIMLASPHMPRDQVILLRAGWSAESDAKSIISRFGREAVAQVRAASAKTILCSGGDTAAAVMDALDARQLILEHELAAGIPIARIEGIDGLRLVTKSGGFGDPGVLSRIVRATTGLGQVAA